MKSWIKNKNQLATTPERKTVLDIIEAGFDAIDTEQVMKASLKQSGNVLEVQGKKFNLSEFEHIYVLGFGKASAKAAFALERILGDKITAGVVISIETAPTQYITTIAGTHPLPSLKNVEAAEKMKELITHVTPNDLVINLISGGGSALLCWTKEEYRQGMKLYKAFLKTGQNITVLNTVRKHISEAKGGGLAKLLYPATVLSFIFSDVAGDHYQFVDSGPTYRDETTVNDAKKIIRKYQLGDYELTETPKEDMYFENVHNIPLVSNILALQKMKEKAEGLGIKAHILTSELFASPEKTLKLFTDAARPGNVLLAGSEVNLVVNKKGGKGGRNSHLALKALPKLQSGDVFAAVASDGLDNSDAAGAIVDARVLERGEKKRMDYKKYLAGFDSYTFFEKAGDSLISTGPTGANTADLLIWYRK